MEWWGRKGGILLQIFGLAGFGGRSELGSNGSGFGLNRVRFGFGVRAGRLCRLCIFVHEMRNLARWRELTFAEVGTLKVVRCELRTELAAYRLSVAGGLFPVLDGGGVR